MRVIYTMSLLLLIFKVSKLEYVSGHGKFPWIVSLAYNGHHICIGSIINSRVILTAASCIEGKSIESLRIRAGSTKHSDGGQLLYVEHAEAHSGYDQDTHTDDLGLLITKKTIEFNDNVNAVPVATEQMTKAAAGYVTGWYKHDRVLSSQLLFAEVKTYLPKKCHNEIGSLFVEERMYCTHAVKTSKCICKGDPGGPLIINGTLHGISSWGNGCKPPDFLAIFTAVHFFDNWIKEIADKKNLSLNLINQELKIVTEC